MLGAGRCVLVSGGALGREEVLEQTPEPAPVETQLAEESCAPALAAAAAVGWTLEGRRLQEQSMDRPRSGVM